MDWSDVGKSIADGAPILGGLLGGPAGGAIGSIVASVFGTKATPDDVAQAIKVNPDAAVKLRQIEADQQVHLQALVIHAETNRIVSVNTTMQAEAKSDHWPTYTWRPFIGFIFGIVFGGVYFVLPIAKIPVPVIPTEAWMAIGAVLGVASWFRGKMQADPTIPTDNRG